MPSDRENIHGCPCLSTAVERRPRPTQRLTKKCVGTLPIPLFQEGPGIERKIVRTAGLDRCAPDALRVRPRVKLSQDKTEQASFLPGFVERLVLAHQRADPLLWGSSAIEQAPHLALRLQERLVDSTLEYSPRTLSHREAADVDQQSRSIGSHRLVQRVQPDAFAGKRFKDRPSAFFSTGQLVRSLFIQRDSPLPRTPLGRIYSEGAAVHCYANGITPASLSWLSVKDIGCPRRPRKALADRSPLSPPLLGLLRRYLRSLTPSPDFAFHHQEPGR